MKNLQSGSTKTDSVILYGITAIPITHINLIPTEMFHVKEILVWQIKKKNSNENKYKKLQIENLKNGLIYYVYYYKIVSCDAVCKGLTFPSLTMMHNSFQSLDDGVHSWIVFLPQLQERSRGNGLQKGLQD